MLIAGWVVTLLGAAGQSAAAQELNCDVTIDVEKIPSAQRDNLRDFEQQLEQYLNGYRWTTEDFGGEKIHCVMTVNFQSVTSDNRYTAQVFVGSRRTIYEGNDPSGRETIILRILDERWDFEYTPNKPIYHDEFQFDAIADFLDYYAYIIIGFDLDTYVELSGAPYFQKALNYCNLGSNSSFSSGWTAQSGTYTRLGFVGELYDTRYQAFRLAFHKYHFDGIDLLATENLNGLTNMLTAIEAIADLRQRIDPRSLLVRVFFDTKYAEIADSFLRWPDRAIYGRLAAADPVHSSTYQEASVK
jgi:hypothetical protein